MGKVAFEALESIFGGTFIDNATELMSMLLNVLKTAFSSESVSNMLTIFISVSATVLTLYLFIEVANRATTEQLTMERLIIILVKFFAAFVILVNIKELIMVQLCSFTSRNQVCERAVYEIAACIQETSHILDQIPDIDESYKRQTVKETEITAFVPEKDELTSELFHGLYDKCRQEIGFGDTVIPATIPLDQVMEELNMIFKTDIDNESELSENKVKSNQFHNNSIALSGDPDYNTIKESEEDLIENTSLFVPAYDEEER